MKTKKYCLITLGIYLVSGLVFMIAQGLSNSDDSQKAPLPEHLKAPFGFEITEGAAAGYINDQACAVCHAELHASYQHVGMARSFSKPQPDKYIEDFDAEPYFHPGSKRYYKVRRDGDDIVFRRYQRDTEGKDINVFERKIDWILGSGNKTRSYLYQTERGELFQFPIGWYTEIKQWRLAPGFENAFHRGVQREVRRECMFCHNGFPEVQEGSDLHHMAHLFPKKLPEGTGCQRCHGPGGNHIRTVLSGESDLQKIRGSIVNPAKLPVKERDSVCFQCHLLPTAQLVGARRFDRPTYSFRPGESISSYMHHVDMKEHGKEQKDRFEINHHAYRLRQSDCFQKSSGTLTCISCHNPHRKVPPEKRVQHYGAVCASCHQDVQHKEMPSTANPEDCVSCHMPQRRTQDVVHVTMTDHLIQKNASSLAERMAPIKETEPIVEGIEFVIPKHSPKGLEGELYKAVTLTRTVPTEKFANRLKEMLQKTKPQEITPYLDLAIAQIKLKHYSDAIPTLQEVLKRAPTHPKALQQMGLALLLTEETSKAEEHLLKAIEHEPQMPEALMNLGILHFKKDRFTQAIEFLTKAITARPNMIAALYYRGKSELLLNNFENAVKNFKRALEINPAFTNAYLDLSECLLKLGQDAEAKRYLRHGKNVSAQPELLSDALKKMDSR